MSIGALRGLLAGLVALVIGLIGVRILLPTQADAALDCGQIARQSAARNHVADGNGSRRIVVLGDSYAQGYGLADQRDSWPKYLAGDLQATVTVRSLGGTGFVSSPCGMRDAYSNRAVSLPRADWVIVEGGLNDVSASNAAIVLGVRATVAETGARTVVVGPANAPRWTVQANRIDRVLAKTCAQLGVRYVSTYTLPLHFGPDGVHLASVADHEVFAKTVADALS